MWPVKHLQIRMAQTQSPKRPELMNDMVAKSKAFKEQYIHMFGPKYTKRGPHKLSRKSVVSRQLIANRTLFPKEAANANTAAAGNRLGLI